MKKHVLVVQTGVLLVAILFVSGCSKGYETKKVTDNLSVTVTADQYPLVKGDNSMSVSVTDATRQTGPDTVQVRYYMPAMPGMAPMEFTSQLSPKGNGYAFTANIPMEGGWKVDVTTTRQGKPAVTATFKSDPIRIPYT